MLKNRVEKINKIIEDYVPASQSPHNQTVIQAMSYSLTVGGKRLRPIFLSEAYQLFKPYSSRIEPFMAAIEFIHTYSLIHDDLPAMDNDDLRRGKPTCHIQYGEDMAILAGDGLLNAAFEVMTKACIAAHGRDGELQAMATIASAAGINGMIGGQVADVLAEKKDASLDSLTYIHQKKTSALIEASLVAGAQLAGATKEACEELRHIGNCIGLAFQIQDDILDIAGDENILGKPVRSDIKNRKMTYVSLKGIEASRATVESLLDEAVDRLKQFDGHKREMLENYIEFLRNRDY